MLRKSKPRLKSKKVNVSYRNLKLSTKLTIGFALVLLLSTVVTFVSIVSMGKIAESTQGLFDRPYTVHTGSLRIQRNIIAMDREMKDIIRSTNRETIQNHGLIIDEYEAEVLQEFELLYERFVGDQTVLDRAFQVINDWKPIRDETIRLQRTGKYVDAATLTTDTGNVQVDLIEEAMGEVVALAQNAAITYNETAQSDANNARQTVIILLALAYVVAILGAAVITISITKPVSSLLTFAREIANGNLALADIDYKSRDEIGTLTQALNRMRGSLHKMTLSLTESVKVVSASSEEMSSVAQETSASVEELASSSHQFASSVDQLSASTQEMTNAARQTSELSSKGAVEIKKTIQTMDEINDVVTSLAGNIRDLGHQSEQIDKIVALITGIADQTNLLALNAAIEAARAGEQGRGFAVVAEEVRKLAEQSARAAGEITQLIHQIRNSALDSVKQADVGAAKVKEGMDVVTNTGQVFGSINAIIEELVDQITAVAVASQELAAGAEEMGATTEQQSGSAEQMAASADHVAQAAVKVTQELSQFKLE